MTNTNNYSKETWSSERVKELTMSKLTPKHPTYNKFNRPLITIAACLVLFFTLSITAYAADAFGVRSFFERNWIFNEDNETIELNVNDTTFGFGSGFGENSSAIEIKSISLSPSNISLSYIYSSRDFETRKPWAVFLIMSDNSFIHVDITDYYIDGDLFTGSGDIVPSVNLDDVFDVEIWRCYGELGYSSSGISVHSGYTDPYEWFARHKTMLEYLENLR